ncbi:MAG: phosphocholine cytidylyltransferase family protein [Deltaproteobacteria bacterium]|nr:phosphocholine cytidylyltransferase family protein [Deltaproteobacteria bacterium]
MKLNNAIILAAGMGVRLRPMTERIPKALITCAGWPLLSYALEFARRVVKENGKIVVVTGFQAEKVVEFLDEVAPDVSVSHNAGYEKANLLSVAAGLERVDGDFLLMNVDHIYPFAFAQRLVDAPGDVVAAVDGDRTLVEDDMKVRTDAHGGVRAISKQLTEFDMGYIGMSLVRPAGLDAYRESFKAAQSSRGDRAVAEDVIQALSNSERPARTCDLSGLSWLEVDTPDDLEVAEGHLMNDPDMLSRGFES